MDITLLDGVDIQELLHDSTSDEKLKILNYLKSVEDYKRYNKINFFKPDVWQEKAIALGKTEEVRGAVCANR